MMGYSGAEVGRYRGVTTSAVNRLAVSEAPPDLRNILSCFKTYVPFERSAIAMAIRKGERGKRV
jgi:hypothetical protein